MTAAEAVRRHEAEEMAALMTAWTERDNRYAMRKLRGQLHPLSLDEERLIRTWRVAEAVTLADESDRRLAMLQASRWSRQ